MTKHQKPIEKYTGYMTEIRHRIDVINLVLTKLQNNSALTGYRESDIELVYLQFRHCLELMMFASSSAHHSYGLDLAKRMLEKEYNATKLFKFIEKKNKNFYPRPFEVKSRERSDGQQEMVEIKDGFLTQSDFCHLYDQACGNMLHAKRISKFDNNHEKLISEAIEYRDKLMKLLNHHWVHLTDDIAFGVFMRDGKSGEVGTYVMQAIKKG